MDKQLEVLKPSVAQMLKLIRKLPNADKHIGTFDGVAYVTNEWLVGSFAGSAFYGNTLEEAVTALIKYLHRHIGHKSMVGRCVTESEFPDLKKVYDYCLEEEKEESE